MSATPEHDTPPAGEEIHLPGPSLLPLISAASITLMVIGTTVGWIWSIIGVIGFIVSTVLWIRSTRRDISELPDEHRHR
ncbi:MAG: hypothetical protein ACRDL8_16185 [Solirubrobacteraceae bacterium]